jgi:hypothetical protein
MAIIVHKQIEDIEANLASNILLAPIKFPTLVAAAKPTDKDITKKKLAIFIAIACPATISLPNGDIIKAAPENIANSIKIPNPIGNPNLKISISVLFEGNGSF